MNIQRVGARDLGLEVEWRFDFVGAGSTVETTRGTVFVDVGNRLTAGVFDEHGGTISPGGTSQLILHHPNFAYEHLLGSWLDRAERGEDFRGQHVQFTIVTHVAPDFDAILSALFVIDLVETGAFADTAAALAAYGKAVDLGLYRVDFAEPNTATHPMHLGILALQQNRDSRAVMESGLRLIRAELEAIGRARMAAGLGCALRYEDFLFGKPGVGSWRTEVEWASCCNLLDSDVAKYLADREIAEIGEVELPARRSNKVLTVPSFILRTPPSSVLNKYWVRAQGFCLFVCPYSPVDGSDGYFHNVIVSVDMAWVDPVHGESASLLGLGYQLEQAEVIARKALSPLGIDDRSGAPRYSDGSCDNDDPWYDGRGFHHTIVAAPRSGTRLDINTIVGIVKSPFLEPKCVSGEMFVVENYQSDEAVEWVDVSMSEEVSDTLRPYIRDCQVAYTPLKFRPLFEGADRSTKRSFLFKTPDGFGGVFAVRWFKVRAGTPLSLIHRWHQGLVEAELAHDNRGGEVPLLGGRLQVKRVGMSEERLEFYLSELVGQAVVGSDLLNHDTLLFSGQTVFGQFAEGVSLDTVLDLTLYVESVSQILFRFSKNIALSMSEDGQIRGGTVLQSRFLKFQTRYWQRRVGGTTAAQSVFDALYLDAQLESGDQLVKDQIQSLSQLEAQNADSQQNILLYVLGLFGVSGFVKDLPVHKGWEELDVQSDEQIFALVLGALVLIFAVYFGYRLYLRKADSLPDEEP